MERISSRQNALVKRFRELARTGHHQGMVLLDGAHLLREALAAHIPIETVAFEESSRDSEVQQLAAETARSGIRTVAVTSPVLEAMAPVRTPSGIVAIATMRPSPVAAVLERSPALVVVLHDVQDPGNVGAVVRVAEACGASGVIVGKGSADPYGWKALRGAMGSAFRLPVASGVSAAEYREALQRGGVSLVAAVPRAGTPLPSVDLNKPVALLFGSEGAGLPSDLIDSAAIRLTIPMRPEVESLNVAACAAIVLYEAARQRSGGGRT